jgi:hypothetical protein
MPSFGSMFKNIGSSVNKVGKSAIKAGSGVGKAAVGSASKLGKGATNTVSKVGKGSVGAVKKVGAAVTPWGGGGGKPAINTGPSPSFKSKMMGQMPGMVNGMAQNYGDPSMMGSVQNAGAALGMQRRPMPTPMGINEGMMPGAPMGAPMEEGIVRGPSQMPFTPTGGMMPGQNTGITGGMQNPGLFQMYNQMLQQRRPQIM